MTVLKVENLIKHYGSVHAVNDVSFQIEPGEVFGLLGPNGAGKTSIISTVVTLEKPTSGRILINNQDISQHEIISKAITGFVPQETISHGYFNVEEILVFQSGYYGLRNNTHQIQLLMKRLGLWEHRHKLVRMLSGGLKKRLMIAKALVHFPQLLLLDEPTAGGDVELRYSIWQQVQEWKSKGMGILFTTHYLEEAEKLCDKVAIIHKGKIQQHGQTKTLIQKLTSRHITITAKTAVSCHHPDLVRQTNNVFEFRIPYSMKIGQFLSQLNWQNEHIQDIQIREGNLEDAFKYVLNTDISQSNKKRGKH